MSGARDLSKELESIPPNLTLDEVAEHLGVHRRTVQRYVKEGTLVYRFWRGTASSRTLLKEWEEFTTQNPERSLRHFCYSRGYPYKASKEIIRWHRVKSPGYKPLPNNNRDEILDTMEWLKENPGYTITGAAKRYGVCSTTVRRAIEKLAHTDTPYMLGSRQYNGTEKSRLCDELISKGLGAQAILREFETRGIPYSIESVRYRLRKEIPTLPPPPPEPLERVEPPNNPKVLNHTNIQAQRKLHQDIRLVARYFGVDVMDVLRVEKEHERAEYLAQYSRKTP